MRNDTGRAQRRHDNARLKAIRFQHVTRLDLTGKKPTAKQVGKRLHTAAECSCMLCGNPRRFSGARTLQEQRQMQAGLQTTTIESGE